MMPTVDSYRKVISPSAWILLSTQLNKNSLVLGLRKSVQYYIMETGQAGKEQIFNIYSHWYVEIFVQNGRKIYLVNYNNDDASKYRNIFAQFMTVREKQI